MEKFREKNCEQNVEKYATYHRGEHVYVYAYINVF